MLVSTRGRYALRVMLALAEHTPGEMAPLRKIAQQQGISEKYLESIMSLLVRADYVEGQRGKGGGYRLTKPPESITVGGILRLTEGSLAPVSCLEGAEEHCCRHGRCKTLRLWRRLDDMIAAYLDSVTLLDLTLEDEEEAE